MSGAEMTYNELLASPDLEKAAAGLSDFDLRAVRGWLARGEATGWPADRVHGVCILVACGRFEKGVDQELRGFARAEEEDFKPRMARNARMEEAEINIKITVDRCHGSEVPQ